MAYDPEDKGGKSSKEGDDTEDDVDQQLYGIGGRFRDVELSGHKDIDLLRDSVRYI